jgi:hypothetical protein
MSASTRAALHRVNDPQGVLALLKIDSPYLSGPVRLVNDTRSITTLGDTWMALQWELTLPDDKSRQAPMAKLAMDNVGRELTGELERLPPGASLKATIILVHRRTPSVVDYQFTAPLTNVRADQQRVTANMGPHHLFSRPAVAIRFDPITAPPLFPG